jgi:hypothetical protein
VLELCFDHFSAGTKMMHKRKTYQELQELARIVAQEIEDTWPQWKKDLSEPKVVLMYAVDHSPHGEGPDGHDSM